MKTQHQEGYINFLLIHWASDFPEQLSVSFVPTPRAVSLRVSPALNAASSGNQRQLLIQQKQDCADRSVFIGGGFPSRYDAASFLG